MGLRVTKVNQCLEKRLKILGFEVMDALALFFVISILNFVTGPLNMRLVTVWIPALVMGLTLWIGKRGKAENFLTHFLKFHLQPKNLSAFFDGGSSDRRFMRSIRNLKEKGLLK